VLIFYPLKAKEAGIFPQNENGPIVFLVKPTHRPTEKLLVKTERIELPTQLKTAKRLAFVIFFIGL